MAIVPEHLERYAADHASPVDPLYDQLREETYAKMDSPQMQVGRIEGRFLKLMAQITGARRVVEVGTFTGYSALCIAEGMPEDGQLTTLDIDPEAAAIARRYFARAPWGSRITLVEGPALASLADIEGPLDMAFIDADKPNYVNYWEAIVPKVRSGGVILVDNVLWSGEVVTPQTDLARAIGALNEYAAADDRVEQVMLTVRDGILLARKR